jgi:hypothetical protein
MSMSGAKARARCTDMISPDCMKYTRQDAGHTLATRKYARANTPAGRQAVSQSGRQASRQGGMRDTRAHAVDRSIVQSHLLSKQLSRLLHGCPCPQRVIHVIAQEQHDVRLGFGKRAHRHRGKHAHRSDGHSCRHGRHWSVRRPPRRAHHSIK